jgi:hypothetical protein
MMGIVRSLLVPVGVAEALIYWGYQGRSKIKDPCHDYSLLNCCNSKSTSKPRFEKRGGFAKVSTYHSSHVACQLHV